MKRCWTILLIYLLLHGSAHARQDVNPVEEYLEASQSAGKTPNHLVNELSPYLLQHAYNPVNWYAWGEEAFARARQENKPVFLSIGYSTCHWCHVMAHESFENEEIANILNKYFISIKVDREERPDIDGVYMSATQLLNGQGGWPMTVFINHELEPFFAGTYFPPEKLGGSMGFRQLLIEVQRLWQNDRSRVERVANNIAAVITGAADTSLPGGKLDDDIHQRALNQIALSYDEEHGGFGNAPKFPRFGTFALLQELSKRGNKRAMLMLQKTLTSMAQGGIYDQLGGGFHRYSVDAEWLVPHFEKMLYSQALLAQAYTRMYQLDQKPLYSKVARATLDFVLRDMRAQQGGFYSAFDADSERADVRGRHAEGAYYLWGVKELQSLLTEDELNFAVDYYALEKDGNIAFDPKDEFRQLNILHIAEPYRDAPLTKVQQKLLQSINSKLLGQRRHRPPPQLDDKIITAWNGMMIAALAEASEVFSEPRYLDAAGIAANFIHDRLRDNKTARLMRRYRNQQTGIDAGLADYAWYIRGLIDLYRVSKNKRWLDIALDYQAKQDSLFQENAPGAYYDSSGEDHSVLFRTRTIADGALPSANAISLANLFDLHAYTNAEQLEKKAYGLIEAFATVINSAPASTAMLLSITVDRGNRPGGG